MRCKTADFCRLFASVNQRRQSDWNLCRPKGIQLIARGYFLPGFYLIRTFDPWFVRRRPGWIEDYCFGFSHACRQWKFRITDTNLIALHEIPILKKVHPVSRNVDNNPGVRRYCVWLPSSCDCRGFASPALLNQRI